MALSLSLLVICWSSYDVGMSRRVHSLECVDPEGNPPEINHLLFAEVVELDMISEKL